MKSRLFWKSVFRRPVIALLMVLLMGATAFGLGEKLTEYDAVSTQAEQLKDYYRPIGTLSSESGIVSAGVPIVEGSEYIDFTDTPRYIPGVMDGLYNADIDGNSSDRDIYAPTDAHADIGVTVSEVLVWAELTGKAHSASEGYSYFFRINEPIYGYPDYAAEGLNMGVYHPDEGDGAYAGEDAALVIGDTYLVRAYYSHDTRITELAFTLRRADPDGKWFLTEEEGAELLPSLLGREAGIQDMNRHSMLAVGTADMSRMPEMQESSRRYYLTEGRWLDAEDNTSANPVCVVSSEFASLRGVELGDSISLTLRDLPESHVGYIINEYKDNYEDYGTETLTLTVVGIYGEISLNPVSTTGRSNYMYIPDSLIPESFGRHDPEVYSGSFSFVLSSPEVKDAFLTGCRQALLEQGIQVQFIERDWESFYAASGALKESAASGLALYSLLYVVVCAVCALVYTRQRAKELAIARALGAKAQTVLYGSLAPYILLAGIGVFAGSLLSRDYAGGRILPRLQELSGETVELLSPGSMAGVALVLLIPAAAAVWFGLLRSTRRSVLEQLQGGGRAVRQAAASEPAGANVRPEAAKEPAPAKDAPAIVRPEAAVKGRGFAALARFTARHALRSPARTALFVLTALVFGFSLAYISRSIEDNTARMDELYNTVQVDGEILKQNKSESVSGCPGFITQDTVDSMLETGFFSHSYLEAEAELNRLGNHELSLVEASERPVLYEVKNVPVCAPSEAGAFFDQEYNNLEIEYFSYYNDSVFTDVTKFAALAEMPVILPRSLAEDLSLSPGDMIYVENSRGTAVGGLQVAGVYDGSYEGAQPGTVFMPLAALELIESDLLYSKAEFEVDRSRNRELDELRTYTDEIISDPEAGLLTLDWVLWDEELREAIGPLDGNLKLMRILHPLVQLLSALTAAGLTALLLMQRSRSAALLRVLGVTRSKARAVLCGELLIPALLAELVAVAAMSLAFPAPGVSDPLLSAAVYLAGCIVGALAGAIAVTWKKPLELLQVKE